jgi:hypothetical protein
MSEIEDLSPRHVSGNDDRIVWEILYACDHYAHRDDAGSNSLPTIKTRVQRITHFIAPTIAMVKAAFAHRHPRYEAVSFTPLCSIDREVTL